MGHFTHDCHVLQPLLVLSFSVTGSQKLRKVLLAFVWTEQVFGQRKKWVLRRENCARDCSFVFESSLMEDPRSRIEADVRLGKNQLLPVSK